MWPVGVAPWVPWIVGFYEFLRQCGQKVDHRRPMMFGWLRWMGV